MAPRVTLKTALQLIVLLFGSFVIVHFLSIVKYIKEHNLSISANIGHHVMSPDWWSLGRLSGKKHVTASCMIGNNNTICRRNVVLIIADDLRPQLNNYKGIFGTNPHSQFRMETPNLDKLARRSLVFTHAYAQFSVCAPSRTSFLTSRLPDTTRVWDIGPYWRNEGGNFTTIPQHFKQQGYTVAGFGKVFHQGPSSNNDDPLSWTEPYTRSAHEAYWNQRISWKSVPKSERKSKPLPDEDVTDMAVKKLKVLGDRALNNDEHFFLAVGFHKPHLPFVCPEEAFDLYPLDKMEKVNNTEYPTAFPDIHWIQPSVGHLPDFAQYNCANRTNFPCRLPDETLPMLRRAYFACVSYVDTQVGRLLDTIDELGLRDSTVISFVGDHGYHLGENGLFGKHTNLEQATRVPFFLSVPGKTDYGRMSEAMVELIDLFPTLAEASGVADIPFCPLDSSEVELCTEGESLMPITEIPGYEVKEAAVSQMVRPGSMGYSLRTDRYRYTEWTKVQYTRVNSSLATMDCNGFWTDLIATEMYDHHRDPEENANVAKSPSYHSTKLRLASLLHEMVPLEQGRQRIQMHCDRLNTELVCA